MQAHFICMAHKLMVRLIAELDREHGIRETMVQAKRKRWLEKSTSKAASNARTAHVSQNMIRRSSQITLQFLRSLRNALRSVRSFLDFLPAFSEAMTSYV